MMSDRAHDDLLFNSGPPFPCTLGNSCEDDPTFLALGSFPCNGPAIVVCSDPLAFDACPVSLDRHLAHNEDRRTRRKASP